MAGQGAFVFGCAGAELLPDEARFFRDADPFGFILFARNIETPAQVRRLTAALREAVGRDAPVLIDQEGGRVQRMRAPHWREWLPPLDQARVAGAHGPRAFWLRGRLLAAELRGAGIDVNCVPCLDIAGPQTHPFLRNRCLGETPEAVVPLGRALAEGMVAGGVLPVMKHMPGHGRATVDSHAHLPRVEVPADVLRATDFVPFRALADLPMGMTSHVVYAELDDRPATLSPVMTRLIREEIGFRGLLLTDDLSMEALSGSVASRAERAVAAGCDLALHCNGTLAEMQSVAEAVGRMSPAAEARRAAADSWRRLPEPVDIGALEAELRALLEGAPDAG